MSIRAKSLPSGTPVKRINFDLTEEDHCKIKTKCSAAGITISDFMRDAVLRAIGDGELTKRPTMATTSNATSSFKDVLAILSSEPIAPEQIKDAGIFLKNRIKERP